jgi:hypothetical protein
VTEAADVDEDWPSGLFPEVPLAVLDALERTGHRIERTRGCIELDLEDERRVVVPVEQVIIVPVERRAL